MRYERMVYDEGVLIVYDTEKHGTREIRADNQIVAQVVVAIMNLQARVEKYSPALAEILGMELTSMLRGD